MDLPLARLNRGQVQVHGDYLNFAISDEGFSQRLLNLEGHPNSGDYVVHLRITDDDGNTTDRIYRINSKFTFKFLNRISLQKSLQRILRPYNAEVINAGLYYKTYHAAYIHNSVIYIDNESSNEKELYVKELKAA